MATIAIPTEAKKKQKATTTNKSNQTLPNAES